MTIEFRCGECSKLLRTTDDKAGATAKCPQCGSSVTVPSPADAAHEEDFEAEEPSSGWPLEGSAERAVPPPPPPREEPTRSCPMCGGSARASDTRCPHCGERLSARPPAPRFSGSTRPHRGGLILAFGILSWLVCPIFGIFALVMGNDDLKEIQAGRMDPAGEGLTQAGRILGMISCLLAAVGILFACLIIGLGAVAGAM